MSNVKFHSKYSPAVGTFKALKDSKNADLFVHFSIQAFKFTNFIRLLKPVAKLNILYTPRISNWHDQKINFRINKASFIENYFNIFRYVIKQKYHGYIVHSKQMADAIKEKTTKKKIIHLPYTYYDDSTVEQNCSNTSEKLRVTILGSIDPKRRDYLSVFDSRSINTNHLNNIEFELAGVPNGSNFSTDETETVYLNRLHVAIDEFSKITGCKVLMHKERLSDIVYQQSIDQADVILMPVNIENYPLGSWSAGLAESIENNKRVIVPKRYDMPAEYPDDYISYSNAQDLYSILKFMAVDKSKAGLNKDEKIVRQRNFSLESIENSLSDFLKHND